jgi:hypothetical protein
MPASSSSLCMHDRCLLHLHPPLHPLQHGHHMQHHHDLINTVSRYNLLWVHTRVPQAQMCRRGVSDHMQVGVEVTCSSSYSAQLPYTTCSPSLPTMHPFPVSFSPLSPSTSKTRLRPRTTQSGCSCPSPRWSRDCRLAAGARFIVAEYFGKGGGWGCSRRQQGQAVGGGAGGEHGVDPNAHGD